MRPGHVDAFCEYAVSSSSTNITEAANSEGPNNTEPSACSSSHPGSPLPNLGAAATDTPTFELVLHDGELERARGPYEFEGHHYCSSYEAACANMLNRFIPGYELVEGQTYQVPVLRNSRGSLHCIDFLVRGNVFIEFHSLTFGQGRRKTGDFNSGMQQKAYRKILGSQLLNQREKEAFKALAESALRENYRRKRLELILENPKYRRAHLLVVTSASELYDRVIVPYSSFSGTEEQFVQIFEEVRQAVMDTNSFIVERQARARSRNQSYRGRSRKRA